MPEQPRVGFVAALGPSGFSRVAYTDWGPLDARHTIICLHGLTRNGRDFDVLAQALARRGCRVVAPDLPGRGRSEWLKRSQDYDSSTYVAAITAVIARLGVDEVDWIGTSLGGFVGMEMAAKPGNPIRRLVLNDFGARVPGSALSRIGATSGQDVTFKSLEDLEVHLRSLLAPFGSLTDAQWRHLAEHTAARSADGNLRLNHDPAITVPFTFPFMFLSDFLHWRLWDAISCPVLVVRGAHSDFLSRETMLEMAKRGRAADRGVVKTVEMPGCGHAPALMSDEQIDIVADFLLQP